MVSPYDPKTLQEAVIYFADFENCREYLVARRWPNGVTCPTCGSDRVSYLTSVRRWQCTAHHAQRQFTLKTGTIMEDSPIGVDKWMIALWLVLNCKNGISSYEIGRALGMSQKSAWHLMHRARYAVHGGSVDKITGIVEADESFIGGKARFMHKDRKARALKGPTLGKEVVFGLLDHETGKVRTMHVRTNKKHELNKHIHEHVELGAEIHTDALQSYAALNSEYAHKVVDHAEAYVQNGVHTNRLENYWSLLKRTIKGTYVSVEPFHLFRYLDEQAFRFNERKLTDGERFDLGVRQIVGKRLTWDAVTGKDQSSSSESRP